MAFAGCLYLWGVPRDEVDSLAEGYVDTTYANGRVEYAFVPEAPEGWVRVRDIARELRPAILVSEDRRFYHHAGFDALELRNALLESLRENTRLRGASTIPQQLAKNLFLTHERSLARKVRELAIALYMDRHIAKDKILEVYLNVIEYGEGVYGIGDASQLYFGKRPADLSAAEAAFLAMLLPNPKENSQSYRDNALTPEAREKVEELLMVMHRMGFLTDQEYQRELETPLAFRQGTMQLSR